MRAIDWMQAIEDEMYVIDAAEKIQTRSTDTGSPHAGSDELDNSAF